MEKNIIILGMSTLPRSDKELRPSSCCWGECNEAKTIEYYSQLEPISRMIEIEHKSLDKIVILATPETRKEVKIIYHGEEMYISAVDFYLLRMNITDSDKVRIIDVNIDEPAKAINESITVIRRFWSDNINDNPKLWIDTQGGFRNMNLIVNAIISLLKGEYKSYSDNSITPSGIYYIKFDRDSEAPYPIQNQTDTYKIFDFVSGINELLRYGRAEQLDDYYKNMEGGSEPEVIKIMKAVAESIQMCDVNGFDKNLAKLRKKIKDIDANPAGNDELLSIFWNTIKEDYGPVLNKNCTGIDIVDWLYRKKFYQQAITYIESKMPKEWVDKGIITYKIDPDVLFKLKDGLRKGYEQDVNIVIGQIAIECFEWNSIAYNDKKKHCIQTRNMNNLNGALKNKYISKADKINVDVKIIKRFKKEEMFGSMTVYIQNKNKYYDTMNMLLLYKLLKNERNNFNHMAEKSPRANQETLGKVIGKFIEYGNKVYGRNAGR